MNTHITMKNIAFIINPISGTQNKKKLPKLITSLLDSEQWLPNIVTTEYAGHATKLAQQFAQMGFDAVIAVGGDGTLNEVATGLKDTKTALGIIPMGSGNGFARHISVPLRTTKAIEMLNHSEVIRCDYGMANDRLFVSTCGTGFDALVAYDFATRSDKRGFTGYLSGVMKEAFTYQPDTYHIVGDGINIEHKAFLLTFANASQWGYEAYIAPKASIQDGKMDICLLSSSALLVAPGLAARLFTKSLDQSIFMDTIQAKDIVLHRGTEAPFHIDGDPVKMGKDVRIRIVEDGLNVLVEKRF